MAPQWSGRLLVVGTGLIGTSVALAATRAGAEVLLSDADPASAALAASLGAGRVADPLVGPVRSSIEPVDLAVVAVPPRETGPLCAQLLRREVATTVTHVCSVQSQPQRDVEAAGVPLHRYLGSHPMAGREVSGPAHASEELFRDRPWVLCPDRRTAPDAVDSVADLARACRALPVVREAAEHDRLVARLSHLPQLVASALAAALDGLPAEDIALAGPGLRDTTRLADSDPVLWAQIVEANAGPVADALRRLAEPLVALADALGRGQGEDATRGLLERGRQGRSMLPGKHGRQAAALAVVQVVVPDAPGALAALLSTVAAEGVNLEDVRVDHAPGQALGIADLVIDPAQRQTLNAALRGAGWVVSAGATEAL